MGNLSNVLSIVRAAEPPAIQAALAISEAGLEPPSEIIMDGKMHRFASDGRRDKAGWYIFFDGAVPAGAFGCWRSGIEQSWRANIGREMTDLEKMAHASRMAEARAARDREREQSNAVAANTVDKIWTQAAPASDDHPYLLAKKISAYGARVTGDGRLIVPLFDADGDLTSLQYISADGVKRFHTDGRAAGSMWVIGSNSSERVYVAEGFATAAAIAEVTGDRCYVAYSASNIPAVAGHVHHAHSGAEMIIVADNDDNGVGRRFAEQAAIEFACRWVMPPIAGHDANDYRNDGHDLLSLLLPAHDDCVMAKLKVCFGHDLSDSYEAPNELIEGLMTIGGSTVLYGDSNSGKTFFALALATAVANNTPFFEREVDGGIVVYLATESPASIRSRMQALKKYHCCNLENLAMVPVPMDFHNGDTDAYDVISLCKAIEDKKHKPIRLIICDTLARMSAGANENSAEDMSPIMRRFDALAQATGAAVLIIHHNGKDAARGARGWSGIRAHIDTEIEVEEKDGIRYAHITKQRELPGKGDTMYFALEVIEMGRTKFGKKATTCVAVPDNSVAIINVNKQSKAEKNFQTMTDAWLKYGKGETRKEKPYLTRADMRAFLIENGTSERSARNMTEDTRETGMIYPQMLEGMLESYSNGWILKGKQ